MFFNIFVVITVLVLINRIHYYHRCHRIEKAVELLERSMPGIDIVEYYKTNPIL